MMTTPSQPPAPLVFVHIPKTGGSTMRYIIQRHYRNYTAGALQGRIYNTLSDEEKRNIRFIVGHFSFRIRRYLPEHTTYLTMLRDPVTHIVSLYDFIRSIPIGGGDFESTKSYVIDNDVGLQEFVEEGLEKLGLCNFQTRYIAGYDLIVGTRNGQRGSFTALSDNALEVAQQQLNQANTHVGITERFHESLIYFQHRLAFDTVRYTNLQVARSSARSIVTDQIRQTILEKNPLDVALFQYGTTLFEQQLETLPFDVAAAVKKHKAANLGFQLAGRLSLWIQHSLLSERMRHIVVKNMVQRLLK